MGRNSEAIEMQGEAERWFFRMQDADCAPHEREACRRWRASSPACEAAYREVEAIWRDAADLADDPAIALALREAEHPAPRPHARRRWWPAAALAASLAVVAVLLPRYWPEAQPVPGTAYATAVGEQRTVTLADGSTAVLDTGTSLVARYSDGERRIELQRGQADFQVQSNPARPFVVHVAGGAVTAVGTRFQVRAVGATPAVTLLEGVVKVAFPEAGGRAPVAVTLAPGERLDFDAAKGAWSTQRVDIDVARSWTEGSLFVKNWRLADLVAEMNRYSTTQLRLSDPALADLPISGTFRAGDYASLVLALQHGWSVDSHRTPTGEIELTRR